MNKLVENYLDSIPALRHPLVFHGYGEKSLQFQHTPDIINMIEKVLDLSMDYPSYLWFEGEEFSYETGAGRWRSVIDIWRHIVFFYPDVTIYQVMEAIYAYQYLFVGHFCTAVQRRVFLLKEYSDDDELYTYDYDEFSLKFSQWEHINA